MNKYLTSSADASRYSLMVKGFLVSILPIILLVTGMTETEVQPIIDLIVDLIFYGGSLIATVQIVYGAARKLYLGRWSAGDSEEE